MTGSFGAAPDELFRAANAISDAVSSVTGMLWQGPSGDYGHPGVEAGWGDFIEYMKAEINKLRDAAEGHGDNLRDTATEYMDSDTMASDIFTKIFEGDNPSPIPGGGWTVGGTRGTGGIGGVLDGLGTTGNAGAQGDIGGIMSPERSREMFPETSGRQVPNNQAGDDPRMF